MTKKEQMEALASEIISENITPELAAQATQLVMGDGNLDAEIIFIGEAPGKNEDQQGIPFVGAAGKFLNYMLEQADLDRGDVYITNIVKYRPPNNRDPRPDEKAAFLPYLLRQIEIIKPKIIATLGRHSMEYFLPKASIRQVHGKIQNVVIDEKSYVIAPLYHPAATLYNGGLRQTLVDDFLQIKSQLT